MIYFHDRRPATARPALLIVRVPRLTGSCNSETLHPACRPPRPPGRPLSPTPHSSVSPPNRLSCPTGGPRPSLHLPPATPLSALSFLFLDLYWVSLAMPTPSSSTGSNLYGPHDVPPLISTLSTKPQFLLHLANFSQDLSKPPPLV